MTGRPTRQLTLVDSTCLIVGIIVGAGIYNVAPDVARGAGSAWALLGLWLLGGVLSLCGALAYAELASAYPESGGDYAYLTRAYGSWAGFLFGWIQLLIVRPGDIAVMAFAFATYACALWDPLASTGSKAMLPVYAVLAVTVLSLINIAGVRQGKITQNILTGVKALGLLGIAAVALFAPTTGTAPETASNLPLSLALILILFCYGGWNEMAYVAAEVVRPERNILRALVAGTAAVTLLYLLVNGAFLRVLGFAGLTVSGAAATDTVAAVMPDAAGRAMSLLVCLSALGAVNGLIFAGARISYAVGRDHALFRPLGIWSERSGTPVRSLIAQGLIAVALVLVLGSFLDALIYTAAPVYLFYLATSLAVMVLRRKDPSTPRPYRVWGYPAPILAFGAVCGWLIWSAVTYKPEVAAGALGILLLGIPAWLLSRRLGKVRD